MALLKDFSFTARRRWLDPKAALSAGIVMGCLAAAIFFGSRGFANFDSALVGYTFACLFSTFGIAYRYAVWLQKPPTRMYWRRSVDLFFSPKLWRDLRAPFIFSKAVWSKLLWQDFILRRGFMRWAGHMAIAWGCLIASAITFPLVFGWLHFESVSGANDPTFKVVAFGFETLPLRVNGWVGWTVLHGLVIASLLVIPGVMIAMHRRLVHEGAVAVQRLSRDLLPLVLLFLVSFTGLMLWVSYEFMDGYFYSVMAQIHAFSVIGTLLYLPFGKLFHIFQRPASIGISYYRYAGKKEGMQVCPITQDEFCSKMQMRDLSQVVKELGFNYELSSEANKGGGSRINPETSSWNQISPQGKRVLIGRAHSRLLNGHFSNPLTKSQGETH